MSGYTINKYKINIEKIRTAVELYREKWYNLIE